MSIKYAIVTRTDDGLNKGTLRWALSLQPGAGNCLRVINQTSGVITLTSGTINMQANNVEILGVNDSTGAGFEIRGGGLYASGKQDIAIHAVRARPGSTRANTGAIKLINCTNALLKNCEGLEGTDDNSISGTNIMVEECIFGLGLINLDFTLTASGGSQWNNVALYHTLFTECASRPPKIRGYADESAHPDQRCDMVGCVNFNSDEGMRLEDATYTNLLRNWIIRGADTHRAATEDFRIYSEISQANGDLAQIYLEPAAGDPSVDAGNYAINGGVTRAALISVPSGTFPMATVGSPHTPIWTYADETALEAKAYTLAHAGLPQGDALTTALRSLAPALAGGTKHRYASGDKAEWE